MITAGLSWWQSWICVWIGYFISAAFVCATGRIGARYHIAFPVASRASFGIWGSLWPVFNRAAMAVRGDTMMSPSDLVDFFSSASGTAFRRGLVVSIISPVWVYCRADQA